MRRRPFLTTAILLVLLTGLATAALAQLTPIGKLGPVNPANGFPEWIEDINGVRLDLPVPPYGDGVTAPTLIFDPVIPGNTLSEAAGFGTEAFYYLANSLMTLPNGGRASLDLAIEAAYGAGDPNPLSPPDQFLFARVRVRFDATVAGSYTVTHPWGVETIQVTPADVGNRVSHVVDWGGFAPLCAEQLSCFGPGISQSPGFDRILVSPKKWVFLEAANKVVQVSGEEAYIIGDGVTPTTLVPTTFGPGGPAVVTTFTITGPPNAFGTTNTASTGTFTVSGHYYGQPIPTTQGPPQPPVVQTDTVTITRARVIRNNRVEVRATSSNGFPMTAELYRGGVGGLLVGSANLGTSGRGNVAFSQVPDTVRVHSTSNNPNILGGADIKPVPFP